MIQSMNGGNYYWRNTTNSFSPKPPKNYKKMKSENFAILMLSMFLIIALFRSCSDYKEMEQLQAQLESANKIKDSLGNTIAVKDAKIVEDQEAMKKLRAELFQTTDKYNKKVKEVKALIAQGTQVIIKDQHVPYVDTSKMKQWEDSVLAVCADVIRYYEDSTVKVGTEAKDSSKWYKYNFTVGKNAIKINEINFIDSQYVALTEMKGGFFKRNTKGKFRLYVPPTTRAEIKHTNPHFQNTGVDAFLFKEKAHRGYGSGVLRGALGGFVIGVLLLTL